MIEQSAEHKQKNRKTLRRLTLVAIGMFGFGFALWPLYNVFCNYTGLGGRAIRVADSNDGAIASDRTIKIRFDANVNSSLSWEFQPKQKVMEYQLGVPSEAIYLAMNPTDKIDTGHATYNVTPAEASLYFVKTQCFCFTEQTLQPHESMEMPVFFYVKPGLPKHIEDITLSYTFYRQGYGTPVQQEHRDNNAGY